MIKKIIKTNINTFYYLIVFDFEILSNFYNKKIFIENILNQFRLLNIINYIYLFDNLLITENIFFNYLFYFKINIIHNLIY